jgi:hypothetical protein
MAWRIEAEKRLYDRTRALPLAGTVDAPEKAMMPHRSRESIA